MSSEVLTGSVLQVHVEEVKSGGAAVKRLQVWVRWRADEPECLCGERSFDEGGSTASSFCVESSGDDGFAGLRLSVTLADGGVHERTVDAAALAAGEGKTASLGGGEVTVHYRTAQCQLSVPSGGSSETEAWLPAAAAAASSSSSSGDDSGSSDGDVEASLRRRAEQSPSELLAAFVSAKLFVHGASGLRRTKHAYPLYMKCYYERPTTPPVRILYSRTQPSSELVSPVFAWRWSQPLVELDGRLLFKLQGWKRGVKDPRRGLVAVTVAELRALAGDGGDVFELPVGGATRRGHSCGGRLRMSCQFGAPVFDYARVADFLGAHPDAAVYRALPDLATHDQRRGVAVPNFRDVGGWPVRWQGRSGRMKSGVLFRSSAVHRASESDARVLLDTLGVASFLDLRTPDVSGTRGPYLSDRVSVMAPVFRGARKHFAGWEYVKQVHDDPTESAAVAIKSAAVCSSTASDEQLRAELGRAAAVGRAGRAGDERARLYQVGLVGRSFSLGVVKRSTLRRLLRSGLAGMHADDVAQKLIICDPIFNRPDGLQLLYEMFVDRCKFEIGFVLRTLLSVGTPAVFYCNHGKDRTGLIAALVQTVCGVDADTVFDGYCLSEYLLHPIRNIVDREMTGAGMTPAIMSPTPRHVMQHTFRYIDEHYGGVVAYLVHIGFSIDDQNALRRRFVDWSD